MKFCVFGAKTPSVTQRSISLENAFKKSKHLSDFFFAKSKSSNNFFKFILIVNNFRFEFKVTVQ